MLKDKVALVTGGGAGIGGSIAEAYAAAGAAVMVTDIDAEAAEVVAKKITDGGGTAASAQLDTTDPDRHLAVVGEIEERFGRLDIAANNAGITIPATPTADLSVEQWTRVRSVDLDGVFYGSRAQIPAMLRAGGGAILTTSSIAGEQGIRAIAVGPAYIRTGLEDNIPAEIRTQLPGMHALGRMGETTEVANAFVWLSSDQASFLTGSYIPVDGGYLAR